MSPIQQLVERLQAELVKAGKIPATVTAGAIELNINQGIVASVNSRYHQRVDEPTREKPLRT